MSRNRVSIVAVTLVAALASGCSGGAGQQGTHRSASGGKEGDPIADASLLRFAESGDAARVRHALESGADVEVRDDKQRTPLLLASAADQVDTARVLVKAGAKVNAADDQQDTPFLVTGTTGSVPMLKVIMPAHPDLRQGDRYGGTALIPASQYGHVDYLREILKTGIEVNRANELGWTPLLAAVVLGDGSPRYQEIAKLLVDHGADVSFRDPAGVNALDQARRLGYPEIAGILERSPTAPR